MQEDISLIIETTKKASRFLHRDYFELENLQSSDDKSVKFSKKSCSKAFEKLNEHLSKYYKSIVFDNEDAIQSNFSDKTILVEVLDGFTNLSNSLPFFGMMVTLIAKKEGKIIAEQSVINLPALGEILYTEKGKGVFVERYYTHNNGLVKARVSGKSEIANALITTNYNNIDIATKLSDNIRIFNSYIYELSLLICGKTDILITESRNIAKYGLELFVTEAGGVYYETNNITIASNFKLYEKIKAVIH